MTTGAPKVVLAIKQNPLLSEHAFRVTNPIRHSWHSPAVIHNVPDDGLVFIRPICNESDHIAEWHNYEMLSWEQLRNATGVDVLLTPQAIDARRPEFDVSLFPPLEVLRVAKKLNIDSQAPVAFYYCFWWGGNVEVEYAWVFHNSERVLIRQTENVPADINRLLELDTVTAIEHDDDVLVRVLRLLSCEIPTGYFVPHTRGFPWHEYRL